uniref:Zgc:113223 n=1 Tax=Oryzias sinensis TaxID=183150 RepID=A0A8C7YEZ7_9TELE
MFWSTAQCHMSTEDGRTSGSGFYAALVIEVQFSQNCPLPLQFLVILAVVFLLQIAAGVVGYLFTDKVMERTEKLMMKAIVRYREDRDLENAIDFVQKKVKKKVLRTTIIQTNISKMWRCLPCCVQFQCCGVENYKDWSQNPYFNCLDTNPSLEACGVPFSCCIHLKNQVRKWRHRELCLDQHPVGINSCVSINYEIA